MLKASALYMVIVIALVIAVLCSTMIVAAYFYRNQYQQTFRKTVLTNNLESGINILLAADFTSFQDGQNISLYEDEADSVFVKRIPWGIYDVGMVKAFIQHDTLYRSFMLAPVLDSLKWGALYLTDEDRPISVSGNTLIRGDAFLPMAGIKEAYVDGRAYQGDKRLVIGKKKISDKQLPPLDESRLQYLKDLWENRASGNMMVYADSISADFLSATAYLKMDAEQGVLGNLQLKNNIIVYADSVLIIDETAQLNNVLVFAPSIVVKEGFRGKCQLFATDSISIEKNCVFDYPSCLGVMKIDTASSAQARINLGENVQFNGVIFSYEEKVSEAKTLINIGKHARISGQIYARGMVRYNEGTEVYGSIFTNRFIYQTQVTLFENYLINATINAEKLSPYYLSSPIFSFSSKHNRILEWLK